jgi:hypothetical protein
MPTFIFAVTLWLKEGYRKDLNRQTDVMCHYDAIVRAKMAKLLGESFLRFSAFPALPARRLCLQFGHFEKVGVPQKF